MMKLAFAIAFLIMFTHSAPVFAAGAKATNRLHTSLMKMPRAKQAEIMKYLINRSGYSCSFVQLQKFDRFNEKRTAIHVVVCAEATYVVIIKTDNRGSTDVIKIRA